MLSDYVRPLSPNLCLAKMPGMSVFPRETSRFGVTRTRSRSLREVHRDTRWYIRYDTRWHKTLRYDTRWHKYIACTWPDMCGKSWSAEQNCYCPWPDRSRLQPGSVSKSRAEALRMAPSPSAKQTVTSASRRRVRCGDAGVRWCTRVFNLGPGGTRGWRTSGHRIKKPIEINRMQRRGLFPDQVPKQTPKSLVSIHLDLPGPHPRGFFW